MILCCPRCQHIRHWERSREPDGPGRCSCGAWAPWRVLKKMPEPGFVRVLSDKGWQELKGPHYQEDPNGWRTDAYPSRTQG